MQFGTQGNLLAIDLGRYGAVPHIAVNGIGKIHNGGASRHCHDLAFWGEHIDRLRKQVNLDVVPELGSVARFLLDIQQ